MQCLGMNLKLLWLVALALVAQHGASFSISGRANSPKRIGLLTSASSNSIDPSSNGTATIVPQEEEEDPLPFDWSRVRRMIRKNAMSKAKLAVPALIHCRCWLGKAGLEQVLMKRTTLQPFRPWTTLFLDTPLYFVYALFVTPTLVHYFVDNTHGDPQRNLSMELMGNELRPGQALLASSLMGGVSGVSEELLFRGIVQGSLVEGLGAGTPIAVPILVQAGLFGFAHYRANQSISMVLQTSLAGVFFGALYAIRGNLAAPMAVHALWNCFLFFARHVVGSTLESRKSPPSNT